MWKLKISPNIQCIATRYGIVHNILKAEFNRSERQFSMPTAPKHLNNFLY